MKLILKIASKCKNSPLRLILSLNDGHGMCSRSEKASQRANQRVNRDLKWMDLEWVEHKEICFKFDWSL